MSGDTSSRSDAELQRRIFAFHDEVAFEYDDERDLWSNHYYGSTRTFLRHGLVDRRPKRILDVGVGSGKHIDLYAAQGAEVCGVDLSYKMLRVAFAHNPVPRQELQRQGTNRTNDNNLRGSKNSLGQHRHQRSPIRRLSEEYERYYLSRLNASSNAALSNYGNPSICCTRTGRRT